jgi:hypothetical protein
MSSNQHPHDPSSPLQRFLRNPGGQLDQLRAHAQLLLLHARPLLAGAAAFALAFALSRLLLWRLRERCQAEGARLLRIGVPPEVDPDGALLLWLALHDLLRPRLRRLLQGQPHLGWEIASGAEGIEFRIWLPQAVPPGLVERALSAAWPGLTVSERVSVAGPGGELVLAASELVLSGPEWFPLGGERGGDPLRLVLGQLAGLEHDETALVQVVCRPATTRERARLHAAARRIRAGVASEAPPNLRTRRERMRDMRVSGIQVTRGVRLARPERAGLR